MLDGVFSDEHGDYPIGTFLMNPHDSRHSPRSENGCTLFVRLRQYPGADLFSAGGGLPCGKRMAARPGQGAQRASPLRPGRLSGKCRARALGSGYPFPAPHPLGRRGDSRAAGRIRRRARPVPARDLDSQPSHEPAHTLLQLGALSTCESGGYDPAIELCRCRLLPPRFSDLARHQAQTDKTSAIRLALRGLLDSSLTPRPEHGGGLVGYARPRLLSVAPTNEQFVVLSRRVANVRDDSKANRVLVQGFRVSASTHTTAVLAAGMLRDLRLAPVRTARIEIPDPLGKPSDVLVIQLRPALSARTRLASRVVASAVHSCSACSRASSSTSSPWRSYRLRAPLPFRTTAESPECLRTRRVKAASPAGRETR